MLNLKFIQSLINLLKSKLQGKFKELILAMMTPLPQYYAKQLNIAINGFENDEEVLIEILCNKSNQEILAIKNAYSASAIFNAY